MLTTASHTDFYIKYQLRTSALKMTTWGESERAAVRSITANSLEAGYDEEVFIHVAFDDSPPHSFM